MHEYARKSMSSDEKILTKLTWSRLAGTSTFHLFQSIGRSTYPLTEPIKCLCHDCWKKSLRFTCHRDRKFYQYIWVAGQIGPRSNCIVTVCVFVRHLFSFYPFYFDFHSARIIFDVSSGFYLWNINKTTA